MIKSREYIIPFLSFILILLLSLLIASLASHTNFTTVLSEFTSNLYFPEKNLFKIKKIAGVNTYIYFYIGYAGSLVGTYLLNILITKKSSLYSRLSFLRTASVLFIVALCLQIVSHFSYFKKEISTFHNAPIQKKIVTRFENSYNFAQYCKTYLSGKHYGEPITDSDIASTKGMLTFFGVAYYLYPIDIRIDRTRPKDCLVIFLKKKPLDIIPDNFAAMDKYDHSSLIAIKRKP